VVSAGLGSSSDCCWEMPARRDWARSRSVTGRVAIHGPQIAPKITTTTPKISAGFVGSMSVPERLEEPSLFDEAGASPAQTLEFSGTLIPGRSINV